MLIKRIFKSNSEDINIKNEPFDIIGKLIPIYDGKQWSYQTKINENVSPMCFPDEIYNYDDTRGKCIFLGAYENEKCIGIAVLKHSYFKYMYLYDLKVNSLYRGKNVAKLLIEKAKEIAKENEYIGLYTQAQDNNLIACKFYLKTGFQIGGIDTKIYNGTSQQDKKDIIFYLDL